MKRDLKNTVIKLVIFLALPSAILAQKTNKTSERDTKRIVLKKSYVGLGYLHAGFQDAKFSTIQYSSNSIVSLNIGTSRETDKYFWNIDFWGDFSTLKTRNHPFTAINIHSRIDFKYAIKKYSPFQIGGKWTIFEGSFIKFSDLGNNSLNYISSSRIHLFGKYEKRINDNMKASFSLAVGLFGMIKEFKSFAYNAPQNVLEDGKFDFQDVGTQVPFTLSYYQFKTIGKLNSFETKLELDFKKRWVFFYHWNMLNYITVKRYPLTLSQHIVGARFNFIHKNKKRISKK